MQALLTNESGVYQMTKPIESNTEELEGLFHNFEVQQYELDATLEALKQNKDRSMCLTWRAAWPFSIKRTLNAGKVETEHYNEKAKRKEWWTMHCEQMAEQDKILAEKEMQIISLKAKIWELQLNWFITSARAVVSLEYLYYQNHKLLVYQNIKINLWWGKAPQIEPYDGRNLDIQIDNWLPTLQRA